MTRRQIPSVRPRLLVGSLVLAIAISVAGGYLLSRTSSGATREERVVLEDPGAAPAPAVAANRSVAGSALPMAILEDNDGTAFRTADLVGTPLIINFWFSTCAPCTKELTAFAAVHSELGDQIRFVGVNPLDTAEVNASFATERGVRYELLRDLRDDLTSKVGIVNYPVTVFVDGSGTIVRQTGALDETRLREYALELLE